MNNSEVNNQVCSARQNTLEAGHLNMGILHLWDTENTLW